MKKVITYTCDHCGKTFPDSIPCYRHEKACGEKQCPHDHLQQAKIIGYRADFERMRIVFETRCPDCLIASETREIHFVKVLQIVADKLFFGDVDVVEEKLHGE
jgi:hypothetical protein